MPSTLPLPLILAACGALVTPAAADVDPPAPPATGAPVDTQAEPPIAAPFAPATPEPISSGPEKSPWLYKMFRFEFDNDSFVGSDDAFSAGWSFQLHSRLMDQWNRAYRGWIGKFPGLGDDGEGRRVVRWAYGISQIIITPQDLSIEAPQPNDAPYAGTLGLTSTWSSYDNDRLAALQFYFGCMGPCSHAEQVQKFVHEDLGLGEPPKGWDNQLSNKTLANVNYEYRHKLYNHPEETYVPGHFAHDLAVGGQVGVGNLTTFLQAELEFRFGWGLTMGFTKIPDPPGIGMVLDPVYFDPQKPLINLRHWRKYFNVVARYAYITYLAPAEGGPTESGFDFPKLPQYPGEKQVQIGMHLVRVPWGVHITYYRYFNRLDTAKQDSIDWVNFSFEYRW